MMEADNAAAEAAHCAARREAENDDRVNPA